MSKWHAASVHLRLLSLEDVGVMCKGRKPASMSVMQYACKAELKRTYLNPYSREQDSHFFAVQGQFGFMVFLRSWQYVVCMWISHDNIFSSSLVFYRCHQVCLPL